ncbi:hypothetical protein HS7_20890 [Sulfolobales archaeon HS-7]|nr:hypothetical protein HS7_20890 [Sulfolobales archaeon HS-7]
MRLILIGMIIIFIALALIIVGSILTVPSTTNSGGIIVIGPFFYAFGNLAKGNYIIVYALVAISSIILALYVISFILGFIKRPRN